jgi:pimeloyl-ACP methyl ester carboxylesterase
MVEANFRKLDAREEHCRIPSHHDGLSLFLRYLPPLRKMKQSGNVVLYVHGGTFPSALSIAHRFDGHSWRDELAASGFHCWGLDFHGFGAFSDPYPEMAEPLERHAPLGRAEDASRQLEQAVRFICAHHRVNRISLIAHSWGSIVSGRFAVQHPARGRKATWRRSPGPHKRPACAACWASSATTSEPAAPSRTAMRSSNALRIILSAGVTTASSTPR